MKVIYTYTDEAPALATHSLLPVIEAFAGTAGVEVELRDISLAGRILAQFPELLTDEQRVPDALSELGALAKTPEANIIKLPNISASNPQLKAAINELQAAGHAIPDYPEEPRTDEERAAREAYDTVKGSAVNPVLREGNSDRRAPASVKAFVRKYPHSMGEWSKDSKTHVAMMSEGDFRSTEASVTLAADDELRIEHVAPGGTVTVLKESLPVLAGEIVDGAVMRRRALDAFLAEQIADAKAKGVLFSLHLKATMMKVSDPIIFGHAVRAFFAGVFDEHGDALLTAGASPNNGVASILTALERLPADQRESIEAAIAQTYETGAGPGDGRLRPRDHQPARAQRRDRRRLDAGDDPHVRPDVERRGRAAGRQGRDPGLQLRLAVRGDDRLLPRARRVRSGDDGHDAERRPDGPEGRGVRQPRQDVRDRRRGRRARGRPLRRRCSSSTRSSPATSGAAARPRTPRWPTGCGSPSSGRGRPARRPSSGSTRAGRTTPRSSPRSSA